MIRVALLGGTGYIGKSLAQAFLSEKQYDLAFFSRSPQKMSGFLLSIGFKDSVKSFHIDDFDSCECDVVINCIGVGSPVAFKKDPNEVLRVTKEFDDRIIGYLQKKPSTIYINMSSGVAQMIESKDSYTIAKRESELRHRALPDLNIVDIRVFSFFSRFIDLESGFLMSEIIKSIKTGKTFVTGKDDIVRDYISAEDLSSLIKCAIKHVQVGNINDFFEAYSMKPVSKIELLDFFKTKYNLKYRFTDTVGETSPTGTKKAYCASEHKAETLGYFPRYTSLEGIESEVAYIL